MYLFQLQIDILLHIKHKNIIGLFGDVYWEGKLCLVLEYANLRTVYDALHDRQKYSEHNDAPELTAEFNGNTIKDVCQGKYPVAL